MGHNLRSIVAALAVCLPVVAAAQDNSLPRTAIADGLKKAECTVPIEEAAAAPDSFDLGDGRKLIIVSCWRAAYQAGSIVFVSERDSQVRLLTFQDWNGKKFAPTQTLSEADYDPNKKTISSFYKGRGIGDCGSMGEWSWTGTDFKLKDYFFKEKCDGTSFAGQRRWRIFPRR